MDRKDLIRILLIRKDINNNDIFTATDRAVVSTANIADETGCVSIAKKECPEMIVIEVENSEGIELARKLKNASLSPVRIVAISSINGLDKSSLESLGDIELPFDDIMHIPLPKNQLHSGATLFDEAIRRNA